MLIRQLIKRKRSFLSSHDIGLFWLPISSQFVTWLIDKKWESKSPDFGCFNGHYFRSYETAKKDFDRRS